MNFTGKVVWITGASSGIGEALAIAFNQFEAKVIISARNIGELERVKSLCKMPENVAVLQMDIADSDNISTAVDIAIGCFNRLDILLNNAGISHRSLAVDTDARVYRKIFDVNFFGTVELTNCVLKYFIKQNKGHIITLSSMSTILNPPNRTAYIASKAAIEGYLKTLRHEIWNTPVKILIVKPGAVKTNIANNSIKGDGQPYTEFDKLIAAGMKPELLAVKILKAISKNKKQLIAGTPKHRLAAALAVAFPWSIYGMVKDYK
ncbi:MAG: SDR family NAD(P)-dependent oxidoreductase [Bacteroidota bacterium]